MKHALIVSLCLTASAHAMYNNSFVNTHDDGAGATYGMSETNDSTMSVELEPSPQEQVWDFLHTGQRGDFWVQCGLAELFRHPRGITIFLQDLRELLNSPILPQPHVIISNPRAYARSCWQLPNQIEIVPEQEQAWWCSVQLLACCKHANLWLEIGIAEALSSPELLQQFFTDMTSKDDELVYTADVDTIIPADETADLAALFGRLRV